MGKATLQIKRQNSFSGMALKFEVHINGEKIGLISNNSTKTFQIPSGRIKLQMKWTNKDSDTLEIDNIEDHDLVKVECTTKTDGLGIKIDIWRDTSI